MDSSQKMRDARCIVTGSTTPRDHATAGDRYTPFSLVFDDKPANSPRFLSLLSQQTIIVLVYGAVVKTAERASSRPQAVLSRSGEDILC